MAREDVLEISVRRLPSPHNAVNLNCKYTRADGQEITFSFYLGQRDDYGMARIANDLTFHLEGQGWRGSMTLERGTFWRPELVDVGWMYASREFGQAAAAASRDVPLEP